MLYNNTITSNQFIIMKDIKGFNGQYSISKDGEVWSHSNKRGQTGRKGKFLKPWLIGNGYKTVQLYKQNTKPSKFLVHRLVAETYIPNPLKLPEVNHINGNKLDNRVDNLEWVTSKENKQHAINRGLYKNLGKNTPRGSKYPTSKLTEESVKEIRRLFPLRKYTYRYFAEKYNVSISLIYSIVTHRSWKHI